MPASAASSKPSAWLGWRPTAAYTCGNVSLAASALRFEASSIPTVRMRVTPAAVAAATSSSFGGSQLSRCVWLSITTAWGTAARGGRRARRRRRRTRASLRRRRGGGGARDAAAVERGPAQREVGGAESVEQRDAALGQPRREQDGDRAQPVGEGAQHTVEVAGARLVLGQLPRRLLLDVAVEPAHALPDRLERLRELPAIHERADLVREAVELRDHRRIQLGLGHRAVPVARDHRDRAAGEVA